MRQSKVDAHKKTVKSGKRKIPTRRGPDMINGGMITDVTKCPEACERKAKYNIPLVNCTASRISCQGKSHACIRRSSILVRMVDDSVM